MRRSLRPSSAPIDGIQKGKDVNWMFATPFVGHIKTLEREYQDNKLLLIDFNDLHALEDKLVGHICGENDLSKLSLPLNSKCYFNEGRVNKGIYKSLERISHSRDVGRCCKAVCEQGNLSYTLKPEDQTCLQNWFNRKSGSTTLTIQEFCNSNEITTPDMQQTFGEMNRNIKSEGTVSFLF